MTASWSVYYSIFCKCRRCLTGQLCQWNRDFYKCKNTEKPEESHKEKADNINGCKCSQREMGPGCITNPVGRKGEKEGA